MKKSVRFPRTALRLLISLALALAGLAALASPPRLARAAGPYVVDTSSDGHDLVNNGVCSNGVDGCSLRAAIDQATFDGVPTTITFASGLDGTTLFLDDSDGTLLWNGDNITVTGTPHPVAISGVNLTGSKSIIRINGSHNRLLSVTIKGGPGTGVDVGDFVGLDAGNDNLLEFLTVIGNGGSGVHVRGGSGGQGNQVAFSDIGLTDSFALGCAGGEGNQLTGVLVDASAGATVLNHNWVGCSGQDGVSIDGAGGAPVGTLVTASRIGANDAGAAVANGLAGVSVLNGARGVTIDSNTLSGNTQQGMYIAGVATSQITVTFNTIGTNAAGALALPNGLDGIIVAGLSNAAMLIDINTISGNGGDGILIDSSADVVVSNNYIGTSHGGANEIFNAGDGVALTAGANHNLIGGTQAAGQNVISGNLGNGVLLDGASTALNQVEGNHIGTNLSGASAVANGQSGVKVDHDANHNTIGATLLSTLRNIISGNSQDGVSLLNGAVDNTVDGNFIGLNAAGTGALPNGEGGVAIIGAPQNDISSPGASVAQYISGNVLQGIFVQNANDNYIGAQNVIGVGADGFTPLGNGSHGVWVDAASNTIVEPGVVAFNGGAGVAVTGNTAAGNKIAFIAAQANAGLPIDLNNDGATANDPGDADSGPNTLLNYPVITGFSGNTASGTVCANCTVFVYKAIGNPARPGGGGQFLGQATANGAGNWSLSGLAAGVTRADLSVAASDTGGSLPGNTSEMSPRWQLLLPVTRRQ